MKQIKTKKKIIKLGLVVILLLMGIIFAIKIQQNGHKAVIGTSQNETREQIEERMENKVKTDIIAADMNQTPVFEDSESEGTLDIENMPENTTTISVEIRTIEDQNLIYESEKIEPGYIIRKDKLKTTLAKGKHLCQATFISYDNQNQEMKRMSTQIEIEMKK